MRLKPLLRTALVRLTLLNALVFLSSALVLAIGGALFLSLFLEREIRSEVEAELGSLTEIFRQQGGPAMLRAVEQRRADGRHKLFDYLVQDHLRVRLAGSLPGGDPVAGWSEVVPPEGEADEPAIAKGVVLADGLFVLVARDAESLHEATDFILEVLGWGLGLAFPLAVGGGIATSIATLRRIETLNRATIEIRSAGMGGRVPVSKADDEFNRLARNINAMLEGIENLTEGIRQVTDDIAHDLRTPLTRLRQDLERAQQPQPEQEREALIERAIQRIDDILDTFSSLLRIAHIESGAGSKQFAWLDLSALFRELAETFATVADDGGRVLTWRIEEGLSYYGDKALLRQMIVNLIENAITHTPQGTALTLELRRSKAGSLAVIADTGPGIPDWARERVFRRFFRMDESRHRRGSGLGLSLVAAIAKHHGISLELSDNAPGLKVSLVFPAVDPAASRAEKRSTHQ